MCCDFMGRAGDAADLLQAQYGLITGILDSAGGSGTIMTFRWRRVALQ
jgi:hypothetical protein